MCAVGFAWFVPDLGFLPSSLAVTVAVITGPIAFGVLGHLFVSFPSGYLRSGLDRWVVGIVYLWTAVGNVIQETFFAPAQIPCDCAQNLFVLHRDSSAHTLAVNMHQIGNLALAFVVLGVVIAHWVRATPPGRRVLFPVALAAGPILAAIVSLNAVGVVGSLDWLTSASPVLTPSAVMTLPLGFLWGLLRARISHGALGHLILELGEGAGAIRLRDALAAVLGDPSLSVAYWRSDARSWVDADGRPVTLPNNDAGRAVTVIERGGQPTAALSHDPSLLSDPWLIESACAAASLAIDNERLRADVAAQLTEVRASRARIVEAADAARRGIERDLHDGAQQRLVSVLITLKLARTQGDRANGRLREVLDEAIDGQQQALGQLRQLASGIHPASLTEGGLAAALQSIVEHAPVPVALGSIPAGRLPHTVEAAAYFVVSEALANIGKHAHAHAATIDVHRDDGELVVEVADDGIGGADASRGTGLRGLADRVAALDGELAVVSPPGRGTRVVVRLPCA
jgi:signal transduction histidine kinase